jgi:hypothetical protein
VKESGGSIMADVAGVVGEALSAFVVLLLLAVTVPGHGDLGPSKEECKKIKDECIRKCTEDTLPTGEPSGDPFFKCKRECLESHGCF